MPSMPIDVSSENGWQLLEGELPEDYEALPKPAQPEPNRSSASPGYQPSAVSQSN